MEKFLDKLSEYHFIQTVIPGFIFVYLSKYFYNIDLLIDKPIYDFVSILIIGFIISRIGSLIVEPILKKIKILNFSNYELYINASKKDSIIKNLSETNNLYRAIIAAFLCILVEKFYLFILGKCQFIKDWNFLIISILIILLFIFSYRKQTTYITKRIETALKDKE